MNRHALALLCAAALAAYALLGTGRLDREPPRIELLPLGGPVRGVIELPARAADASPGLADLRLYAPDGRELPVPLDTAVLPDGRHRLRLVAVDRSLWANRAEAALDLVVDNTPPKLEIASVSLRGSQGRTLPLAIRASEPLASLSGVFLGKRRAFYPLPGGVWRALVGIEIEQEPGRQLLVIGGEDAAGNPAKASLLVEIEPTGFPRGGFIQLTGAQEAAREDEASRARTRKDRDDVYRYRLDEALWSGPLQKPISGRRTSVFGRYRAYSDGRRSYHSGTDLAAPTGTPVAAAAGGVVRYAGWQHIFGNVVMLDHGQGVGTSYNHLSAVSVAPGQRVAAGEIVGAVGSTGQSTGPHLHWGLVVDGVAVDAEEWLAEGFASFAEWAPTAAAPVKPAE